MPTAGFIAENTGEQGAYRVGLLVLQVAEGGFLYMHSSNEQIITALNPEGTQRVDYLPVPFKLGVIEHNDDNSLPKVSISVGSTPNDVLPAMVRGNNGLRGFNVWLIIGLRNFMGEPNTIADEAENRVITSAVIDSATITDSGVSCQLSHPLEAVAGAVPARSFYRHFCSRLKDPHAGTSGASDFTNNFCYYADVCDHTYASCKKHSLEQHYGGFPNIPVSGRYYVV